MREYTTLGSGKSTKILAVDVGTPARAVTTCSATAAAAAALALQRTDRCMPAALYGLAVDLAGTPVEARRQLLGFFDETVAGNIDSAGPLWEPAETLVAAAAEAVRSEPAAVIAAVRKELASHLDGFDGVLLAARIVSFGHRRGNIDLVVSGALAHYGDRTWEYMISSGDLERTVDDDALFPSGADLVTSTELDALVMELYDAEPYGTAYELCTVQELLDEHRPDDYPVARIRADWFMAWCDHHRPAEEAASVRAMLTA